MPTIPQSHRDLSAPTGLLSDCTVQISLVTARQKYKNVIADTQATLFIIDPKNGIDEIRATGGR